MLDILGLSSLGVMGAGVEFMRLARDHPGSRFLTLTLIGYYLFSNALLFV